MHAHFLNALGWKENTAKRTVAKQKRSIFRKYAHRPAPDQPLSRGTTSGPSMRWDVFGPTVGGTHRALDVVDANTRLLNQLGSQNAPCAAEGQRNLGVMDAWGLGLQH